MGDGFRFCCNPDLDCYSAFTWEGKPEIVTDKGGYVTMVIAPNAKININTKYWVERDKEREKDFYDADYKYSTNYSQIYGKTSSEEELEHYGFNIDAITEDFIGFDTEAEE